MHSFKIGSRPLSLEALDFLKICDDRLNSYILNEVRNNFTHLKREGVIVYRGWLDNRQPGYLVVSAQPAAITPVAFFYSFADRIWQGTLVRGDIY